MGAWLKGLIAAACLAVLAATGWWGWSEWGAAQARNQAADEAARWAQFDRDIKHRQRLRECQMDVSEWDAGNRAALEREFGDMAEEIVENCRYLIAIPQD